MLVMTVADADGMTGEQLAERLLHGVDSEPTRAAARLLGAHRNGYWLRRFLKDEWVFASAAEGPVIVRSGRYLRLDWDEIALLMQFRPSMFKASSSELAVLQVAVSLMSRCPVQLGDVTRAVEDKEFRLILRAQEEAACGDAPTDEATEQGAP
ncbi:hypothetical protein J7E99_18680 [Streptomyces sp. ISL-44]|uniref:hypothetical protein n=1 Tax=Streptomyces sp. ISL-44 TaxID=2819184 RepID=UPI001BE7B9E5|nr:hypothetical protein [Streptomyces sp. ISL-44]MBT2542686.1 hypothetical protein [Streptomyces sp. ISL-44]